MHFSFSKNGLQLNEIKITIPAIAKFSLSQRDPTNDERDQKYQTT